jgi:hypothetical protein
MITVIDEMVVKLGLDNKDLKTAANDTKKILKDTTKDFKTHSDEIGRASKKTVDFIEKIGYESKSFLTGIAGLLGAGVFAKMIESTIEAGATIGRFSADIGINAGSLYAWQKAIEQVGGSASAVNSTMANLSNALSEYKIRGYSNLDQFLTPLHVNLEDVKNQAEPLPYMLEQIGKGLKMLFPNDRANAFNYAKMMGIDQGTFDALWQLEATLKNIDEIKIKSPFTKETIELSERYQKDLEEITQTLDRLKMIGAIDIMEYSVDNAKRLINPQSYMDWINESSIRIPAAINGWIDDLHGFVKGQNDFGFKPIHYSIPRSVRNNNPGNLNYVGQSGATLESGSKPRFAAFQSMEEGVAAMVRQLGLYSKRGIDTVSEIISVYAPKKDRNNTAAYIASLSKMVGLDPNELVNLSNSDMLTKMIRGISIIEGGRDFLTPNVISTGIGLAQSYAKQKGMNIGTVNVHTQAKDADGIARDMFGALAAQADRGMD